MFIRLTTEFYSNESIAKAYKASLPNSLGFLTVWSGLAKRVLQSGKPMKRDPKLERVSLVVEVDDAVVNSPAYKAMEVEGMVGIAEEEAPKVLDEEKYEAWFQSYPYRDRNGKKVRIRGKSKVQFFNHIRNEADYKLLMAATREYAKGNSLPKDPERFFKNDFWKEWIPGSPAVAVTTTTTTSKTEGLTAEDIDKLLE